jgi:lipid II:glycine glycyltransferase (peptidoglycan interpeptide bridge formation enzyme)
MGGQAKPWEHFVALRECLEPAQRSLSVAMLDGRPAAALLLLFHGRTVEYLTPVIRHEYRARQPLSFLIYHGMVDAAGRGMASWNWGGTWESQESLHHFKAGWGADDHPYVYLIHATDGALASLRQNLARWREAFPFFYLVPFRAVTP